jgi:hypothetical protein
MYISYTYYYIHIVNYYIHIIILYIYVYITYTYLYAVKGLTKSSLFFPRLLKRLVKVQVCCVHTGGASYRICGRSRRSPWIFWEASSLAIYHLVN